jgi:hypothetical protein
MPRQRKPKVEATAEVPTQTNNSTTTKEFKMPLSADEIRKIYAERRTKGEYIAKLTQFMESNEVGISVKEEWSVAFGDKKATTLKQGFENAKQNKEAPDGSELIDVIVEGENVYLINKMLAENLTPEAVEA